MELYFSPLACSMATRISLHEAGASAVYTRVDLKAGVTEHGDAFREINPLGQVPVLRTDDGTILTENAAILQYVADAYPHARLAPVTRLARARLQRWLSFIGSELHARVFSPLLDASAPEAVRQFAVGKSTSRLALLDKHLENQPHLLDEFSVADAYLVTVLGWATATPISLRTWPAVAAYAARLRERPSVARALSEERPLFVRP